MRPLNRPPAVRLGLPLLAALALLAGGAARAAKGDKVPNPDKRAEKIERKLERAGTDPVAALPSRAVMAAAPVPEPDRSYRSGSSRSSRSDRSTYREPTSPADARFDAFRLIVERNIFNPNRIGRVRSESLEKAPRVDTIALVGTMQDDKRTIAFFDSPDAAFRKTLREGQSVGEFKVEQIKSGQVELSRNGKPVTLKVAEQLRRPQGGEWSVSVIERPSPDAPPAGAMADAARPAEPPPIPADASDALRRLMEQRQKQLKQ